MNNRWGRISIPVQISLVLIFDIKIIKWKINYKSWKIINYKSRSSQIDTAGQARPSASPDRPNIYRVSRYLINASKILGIFLQSSSTSSLRNVRDCQG